MAVETPQEVAPTKRRQTSGFCQVEEVRETVRVDVLNAAKWNSGNFDPARACKGFSAKVIDYKMAVGDPCRDLLVSRNNVLACCWPWTRVLLQTLVK